VVILRRVGFVVHRTQELWDLVAPELNMHGGDRGLVFIRVCV